MAYWLTVSGTGESPKSTSFKSWESHIANHPKMMIVGIGIGMGVSFLENSLAQNPAGSKLISVVVSTLPFLEHPFGRRT